MCRVFFAICCYLWMGNRFQGAVSSPVSRRCHSQWQHLGFRTGSTPSVWASALSGITGNRQWIEMFWSDRFWTPQLRFTNRVLSTFWLFLTSFGWKIEFSIRLSFVRWILRSKVLKSVFEAIWIANFDSTSRVDFAVECSKLSLPPPPDYIRI